MSALRPFICKSMTEEVSSSLRQANICTVTDFITKDKEDIAQQCGIAYKDVLSIRRVLLAQFSSFPVSAAQLFSSVVSSQAIFSSGIASLDELLEGGLYAGDLYELTGQAAAGKTQVCLRVAITVARLHGQNSVYIDTCGSVTLEGYLHTPSPDHDLTDDVPQPQEIDELTLRKVCCVQVHDVYSLMSVVDQLHASFKSQSEGVYSNVKVVIVDCIAAIFSPIQGAQQINSSSLLEQLGHQLKSLAVDYNVAVLVTNNVTCGLDGGQPRPSLGRLWSHVPHTRVLLEKTSASHTPSSLRTATVVKSVRLATPTATQFDLASVSGKLSLFVNPPSTAAS